jgi:hypothetical protein
LVQKQLDVSGASNVFYKGVAGLSETALNFGNLSDCQTKSVLRKAKAETSTLNRLHDDCIKDILLTKELLEAEDDVSERFPGYIQSVGIQPFHVILYTEKQIEILISKIQAGDGILHLDATGTVVRSLGGTRKRKVLYYALVTRHTDSSDPPLPVAELLTDVQTTPSVCQFLMHVRHAMVQMGLRVPIPRRVEVDFSWTLIHSVLLVFNHEDISTYLQRTYNTINEMYTAAGIHSFAVVHVCASHLIKRVRDRMSSTVKNKGLAEFIMRVFALMQNCTVLADAIAIWKSLTVVLMSRTGAGDCKRNVRLLERQISTLKSSTDVKQLDQVGVPDVMDDAEGIVDRRPIRDASPYTALFPLDSDPGDAIITNTYHAPTAALAIQSYMHLIPLWSGIMLGNLDRYASDTSVSSDQVTETRDTNATVENWMKIVKKDTLRGERRLKAADFIRFMHPILKGRVRAFACKLDSKVKRRRLSKERSVDAEPSQMFLSQETWKSRGTRRKGPRYYTKPTTLPKPTQSRSRRSATDVPTTLYPLHGIMNSYNTCWLNSSLQALKYTDLRDTDAGIVYIGHSLSILHID